MRNRAGKVVTRADYTNRPCCERWASFTAFLEDMGEPPPGTTLDRIDNTKGYEPGNCRWATWKEQNRNRSCCRFLEWNGQRRTLAEWSELLGFTRDRLNQRLRNGWSVERALTTPVKSPKGPTHDCRDSAVLTQDEHGGMGYSCRECGRDISDEEFGK